jgi:FMN phosphatase YigB (HAD superfamily)
MKESLDTYLKAILFDLDGTLLEVELDKFIPAYLKLLAESVAHLIPPKKFIPKILKASKAVEEHHGNLTNEEVFINNFFPIGGYSSEDIEPFFNKFYQNDFSRLRQYTKKIPKAREVIQKVFNKGYDVIIATTPVLPLTAIEQRLQWADVAKFPYRLITTIENSHATKTVSHLYYYEEILATIGYKAEECLMVGDEDKDMIAKKLGIHTFLIESNNTKLNSGIPKPDYTGTLEDLLKLI